MRSTGTITWESVHIPYHKLTIPIQQILMALQMALLMANRLKLLTVLHNVLQWQNVKLSHGTPLTNIVGGKQVRRDWQRSAHAQSPFCLERTENPLFLHRGT